MLRAVGSLLLVAVGAGLAWPAGATLLAKEQCEQIKAEQTALGPKKLRDAMEKGPAWAKANLTAGEYELMRKYIELEEQLLFRCPQPRPPKSLAKHLAPPAEDSEDDEKPAAKTPAKKAPAEKSAPVAKTPAEPAAKKASAAPPPKAAAAPAPAPAPKAKDAYVPPKPKANDAFVAPPKSPTP